MTDVPNIPNFEKLSNVLKEFKESSDEDSIWIIQEMYEIEGYDQWLEWMETYRPNELP